MLTPQMVLHEEEHKEISVICDQLVLKPMPSWCSWWIKTGNSLPLPETPKNMDTTSLASLAAGNIAATVGLAKLIGEENFPSSSMRAGVTTSICPLISQRLILVVIFDHRSTVGLVRLREKRAGNQLTKLLDEIDKNRQGEDANPLFAEIRPTTLRICLTINPRWELN